MDSDMVKGVVVRGRGDVIAMGHGWEGVLDARC